MNTRRIRRAVTGLTLGIGALAAPSALAAATDDQVAATDGVEVIKELCTARKGLFFVIPGGQLRCQAARGVGMGFDVERNACEQGLGGSFTEAPSFSKPNRTTWACFV
jgi:hypothetical protein